MEDRGIPLGWLFAVILGLPLLVTVFFGTMQFRRSEQLVFRCQRCSGYFTRLAWRSLPRRCRLCKARDWRG